MTRKPMTFRTSPHPPRTRLNPDADHFTPGLSNRTLNNNPSSTDTIPSPQRTHTRPDPDRGWVSELDHIYNPRPLRNPPHLNPHTSPFRPYGPVTGPLPIPSPPQRRRTRARIIDPFRLPPRPVSAHHPPLPCLPHPLRLLLGWRLPGDFSLVTADVRGAYAVVLAAFASVGGALGCIAAERLSCRGSVLPLQSYVMSAAEAGLPGHEWWTLVRGVDGGGGEGEG
ncbi:hypothetical protein PSPO01_03005 [Paraphaeosphaeria sporulosa]